MLSPPSAEPIPHAPTRPSRSEQERVDRARMRTVAVVAVGVVAGALLWVGRTHLAGEFRPLVDSAAVFLLAPFVLGVLMRTRRGAAGAGVTCALVQLGTWAGLSALRGGMLGASLVLSSLACAMVGGPMLGAAGQLTRRGAPAVRGLGAALAAAVLIAEGVWRDLHRLHAVTIGWLSIACGAALCVALLGRPERVRWLVPALPLAFAGEIALTAIHQ